MKFLKKIKHLFCHTWSYTSGSFNNIDLKSKVCSYCNRQITTFSSSELDADGIANRILAKIEEE